MRSRRVPTIMFSAACWLELLLPGVALAQFNYTTNDGAITITKYTGPGGEVVIPGTIDGLPVTGIGKSAFFNCVSLTGVLIPGGVASIGSYAFLACPKLLSVTISGSVTNVGDNLFKDCGSLVAINVDAANPSYSSADGVLFDKGQTTLIQCPGGKAGIYTIPSGVTDIGRWALVGCTRLTAIAVDAGNGSYSSVDGVLFDRGRSTLVRCPASKVGSYTIPSGFAGIGDGAFNDCSGLTNVTIPAGVTSIGDWAFGGCSSLASVTIPGGVTNIGQSAFWGCEGLTSVAIPAGVNSIGQFAFGLCGRLTEVTIPGSVTSIVNAPFLDCSRLTSITVDAANPSYSSMDGVLFDKGQTALIQCPGGKAVSYAVPEGVTKIGHNAFIGCAGLTSVTVPGSVTKIGGSAFSGCGGLTGVYFKGNAPRLDGDSLGSGVEATIYYDPGTEGWAAEFGGCPTATWNPDTVRRTVPLPSKRLVDRVAAGEESGSHPLSESSTAAAKNPFCYTTNNGGVTITKYTGAGGEVVIPGTIDGLPVTGIGDRAFQGSLPIGPRSPKGESWISSGSPTSVVIPRGVTRIGEGAFQFSMALTNVTIPDSVASIGNFAFSTCTGLVGLAIPSGVTNIGHEVFRDCRALTDVAVPAGVTRIGAFTFYGCSGLTNLVIPAGVTAVDRGAFDGCKGLAGVTIPEGVSSVADMAFHRCIGLTNITIPGGVTNIGLSAFNGCIGLGTVTIPPAVTRIGSRAFSGCIGLTNVIILGDVMGIGDQAFAGCSNLTTVAMPAGVTSIAPSAFYGCTGLTNADLRAYSSAPETRVSRPVRIQARPSGAVPVPPPRTVTPVPQPIMRPGPAGEAPMAPSAPGAAASSRKPAAATDAHTDQVSLLVVERTQLTEVQLSGESARALPYPGGPVAVLDDEIHVLVGFTISVYSTGGKPLRTIPVPQEIQSRSTLAILPDRRIAILASGNDTIYFMDERGSLLKAVPILEKPDRHMQNLHAVVVGDKMIVSENGHNEVVAVDLGTYEVSLFRGLHELRGWLGAIAYSDGVYYLCQANDIYAFAGPSDPLRKVATTPVGNITGVAVVGGELVVVANGVSRADRRGGAVDAALGVLYKVDPRSGEILSTWEGYRYPGGVYAVTRAR